MEGQVQLEYVNFLTLVTKVGAKCPTMAPCSEVEEWDRDVFFPVESYLPSHFASMHEKKNTDMSANLLDAEDY